MISRAPLRARWLGRVDYREAADLQRALHEHSDQDHLLLLEHPHTYTLGTRADPEHVLVPPATVGAELVHTDRGGDVTYHGPGQLVGYPIVTLAPWRDGAPDVIAHVRRLEAALIEALARFGVRGHREDGFSGVWVGDEKIAAIGVKVAAMRTRHGFALNVDPDLGMFDHIVPCGIRDRGVTSMKQLLGRAAPPMREVVDAVVDAMAGRLGHLTVDRQDVAWRQATEDLSAFSRGEGVGAPVRLLGRLAAAGVEAPVFDPTFRRPEWMRVKANLGAGYRETQRLMREGGLNTVCQEAGCPNIFECWADRTATFMILGERCTRACGFCLVDTRKPAPLDLEEPTRLAETVVKLGLAHTVVTSVARDDLADGGASAFVATIEAIRRHAPETTIEVLIPDCKGEPAALEAIFAAHPDVLNHNLETVARLQRAARPSAGYARSLALLGRANQAGLVTKSGIILGMGERIEELHGALVDLRGVGVDIVTLGQYLRPSENHLPVVRWWTPDEFDELGAFAKSLGFAHVESGPLVRSSYHARAGAAAAATPVAHEQPVMGRVLDAITPELTEFLEAQPVFFVATAPASTTDHVNVSPKGLDSFRVLDAHTVAYLDLHGSGIETVAHIRENGRITLMFCAFEGRPQIIRLQGRGTVIPADAPEAEPLLERLPSQPGARCVICVEVERISSSCGYAVPLMELVGERTQLTKWAEAHDDESLAAYRSKKNAVSISGLPGWQ